MIRISDDDQDFDQMSDVIDVAARLLIIEHGSETDAYERALDLHVQAQLAGHSEDFYEALCVRLAEYTAYPITNEEG